MVRVRRRCRGVICRSEQEKDRRARKGGGGDEEWWGRKRGGPGERRDNKKENEEEEHAAQGIVLLSKVLGLFWTSSLLHHLHDCSLPNASFVTGEDINRKMLKSHILHSGTEVDSLIGSANCVHM